MKLLTLLKDLPSHTLTGSPQVKISHLECDSRRILPGSCYIALKGTRADGHEFIPEAIRRGACAVVAEMPCTQGPLPRSQGRGVPVAGMAAAVYRRAFLRRVCQRSSMRGFK